MYVEKPATCLRDLRSLANRGAILSLLEKNKDGIALRPGLSGDYREAKRLLDDAVSTGRLGVENVARAVEEWVALLSQTGWHALDWAGVRLFSDTAPDDLSPEEFDALLNSWSRSTISGKHVARPMSPAAFTSGPTASGIGLSRSPPPAPNQSRGPDPQMENRSQALKPA